MVSGRGGGSHSLAIGVTGQNPRTSWVMRPEGQKSSGHDRFWCFVPIASRGLQRG